MKQFMLFSSIAIFSIFVGSQITEGILLVPYWQSLSTVEFYDYYDEFGHSIGQFYTVLTVVAALIPIAFSLYFRERNPSAFKFALVSSFFALLFITSFYIYFKGTNELFYQATLSDVELKKELITWSYWHWGRIIIEIISLLFLILSFVKSFNSRY